MKNSDPPAFFKILPVLVMIITAVLFPAAFFIGFSYDLIVSVILILLIIILAALIVLCSHAGRGKGGGL